MRSRGDMSSRDWLTLSLAYKVLRVPGACNSMDAAFRLELARDVLRAGESRSQELLNALPHTNYYRDGYVTMKWRLLRARLALYLRVILRADEGRFGPFEWVEVTKELHRSVYRAEYIHYVPLWEQAPRFRGDE